MCNCENERKTPNTELTTAAYLMMLSLLLCKFSGGMLASVFKSAVTNARDWPNVHSTVLSASLFCLAVSNIGYYNFRFPVIKLFKLINLMSSAGGEESIALLNFLNHRCLWTWSPSNSDNLYCGRWSFFVDASSCATSWRVQCCILGWKTVPAPAGKNVTAVALGKIEANRMTPVVVIAVVTAGGGTSRLISTGYWHYRHSSSMATTNWSCLYG